MESVSGTAGNTPLLVTRNVEDDEVPVSHVWGGVGSVDEGTDCRKIFKVHVNVHACLKSKKLMLLQKQNYHFLSYKFCN